MFLLAESNFKVFSAALSKCLSYPLILKVTVLFVLSIELYVVPSVATSHVGLIKSTKPTFTSFAVFTKFESSTKTPAGKVTTKLPLLSPKFDNVNVYSTQLSIEVGPSSVFSTVTGVPSILATIS